MYSEQFIQAAEKACKELTDVEKARILESIGERRPMPTEIANKLYDLMEEYGEDNNLPEDWWLFWIFRHRAKYKPLPRQSPRRI